MFSQATQISSYHLSTLNLQTCLKILTLYCYITSTLFSYLIEDLSAFLVYLIEYLPEDMIPLNTKKSVSFRCCLFPSPLKINAGSVPLFSCLTPILHKIFFMLC